MPEMPGAHPTVALLTLGCAKNEVDSQEMEHALVAGGYTLTDAIDDAEVVIVNTCAFIEDAVEESIDAILELADDERVSAGERFIVVSGCLASRYGEDLARELPEVALFVPCARESSIVSALEALNLVRAPESDGDDVPVPSELAHPSFAYVKISEGCDRHCSFCTIPSIRGSHRSFPLDEIIRDVDAARARGVREIDLIAQDTGRWGTDFAEPSSLADLIATLDRRFGDLWFRILYLQPDALTDELLATIARAPSFCHYLDIPIQHVDPDILRLMGRRGDAETFAELCGRIRALMADVVLRTTLIVGFPGETPERFEALCDFIEAGHFDYVGVFPYSAEESTRAANLPDPVDEEEKLRRWQIVRDLADAVSARRMRRFIGTRTAVLVDGIEEDGQRVGRTRFQAPDVDGVTFVPDGDVGAIVEVTIDDAYGYDLEGLR